MIMKKLFAIIAGIGVLIFGFYLWKGTDHAVAAFLVSLLGLTLSVAGLIWPQKKHSKRTLKIGGSMRRTDVEFDRKHGEYSTDDRIIVGKDVEDSTIIDK